MYRILSHEMPHSEFKTRDTITEDEFDQMIQTGLEQAKSGEAVPYKTAFEQLMRDI